jgi:uncharacterized membrane protein YkoI
MRILSRSMIALAVAGAFAGAALAADAAKPAPLDLAQAMDVVAKAYPGRVISGMTDAAGGDRTHHHVDMLLINGRVAKFDVDAHSRRIYNRLPSEEAPAAAVSLEDAVRKVQKSNGRVLSAEFDPDPSPHYHMTVRTPKGELTRLDVDLATGEARRHRPRT